MIPTPPDPQDRPDGTLLRNASLDRDNSGQLPEMETAKLVSTVLRTPDSRFAALTGFPNAPLYLDDLAGFEGMRLHYTDYKPERMRGTFVCFHGQKCWSYSFRKIIPPLVRAGFRVITMDFFGFGRSDKPSNQADYSFSFHRNTLRAFLDRLDIEDAVLIGHDWGGWLGATLPMEMPHRIRHLVLASATLRTSEQPIWPGFHMWRSLHNAEPNPDVGAFIASAENTLCSSDIAAYDAPFPDFRYKAGVRQFPNLVPTDKGQDGDEISRRALAWLGRDWQGTAILIAGANDAVMGVRHATSLAKSIRGASVLEVDNAAGFVFEHGDRFIGDIIERLDGEA